MYIMFLVIQRCLINLSFVRKNRGNPDDNLIIIKNNDGNESNGDSNEDIVIFFFFFFFIDQFITVQCFS